MAVECFNFAQNATLSLRTIADHFESGASLENLMQKVDDLSGGFEANHLLLNGYVLHTSGNLEGGQSGRICKPSESDDRLMVTFDEDVLTFVNTDYGITSYTTP